MADPELWRYHPSQIAVLTDFQIFDFYIRRHNVRVEKARAEAEANNPAGAPKRPPARPMESRREQMVAILMKMNPKLTREEADRDFDNYARVSG